MFSSPINQMLTQGSFRISREEVRSSILEKVEGTYRRSGKSEERIINKTNCVGQFIFIFRCAKLPICRVLCYNKRPFQFLRCTLDAFSFPRSSRDTRNAKRPFKQICLRTKMLSNDKDGNVLSTCWLDE